MARGNISRGMSQKHIKNNLRVHLGPCAYRSHSIKMQTEIGANSQLPTFKSNKHGSIPDLGSVNPALTCFYLPNCSRPFPRRKFAAVDCSRVRLAVRSSLERASAHTSGTGFEPLRSGRKVNCGDVFAPVDWAFIGSAWPHCSAAFTLILSSGFITVGCQRFR